MSWLSAGLDGPSCGARRRLAKMLFGIALCQPGCFAAIDRVTPGSAVSAIKSNSPGRRHLDAGSRHGCSRLRDHPFGRGYFVPAASYLTVARDACAGRILLAEQQVMSLLREHHSYIYDFVPQ